MKRSIQHTSFLFLPVLIFLQSCGTEKHLHTNTDMSVTHSQVDPKKMDGKESKVFENNSNVPSEVASESKILSDYAKILGVPKSSLTNKALYLFINDWLGAPYHYGGKTKAGVDCSGFCSNLYRDVFGKVIGGSSADIFTKCTPLEKSELKEGDLVFFKINHTNISHMGVYLWNNKFVHATVNAGVTISDLTEEYYTKYYYKGGRLIQ